MTSGPGGKQHLKEGDKRRVNHEDYSKDIRTGKTSMLQDVEAGRKTEVEIFAGKVVALGEECRVPTPVNETLLRIIKVMESYSGL